MAFRSRREAFLDAVTPASDDDDLAPGLAFVADLLRGDSKKLDALVKRAAEALKSLDVARRSLAELESQRARVEQEVESRRVAIEKAAAAHDARVKTELKSIELERAAVDAVRKDTESLKAKAAAAAAQWDRKLSAFDKAV